MMTPIFCDNHLFIINKPSGMPTQTHSSGQKSAHALSKEWIKNKYKKKGNVFLEPVHRLDQPVSGLVLFARTSKALSRLNAQIRDRAIIRTYFATVEGCLPDSSGVLEHDLLHDAHFARVTESGHPLSKKAILHYKVLSSKPCTSCVELIPISGRYHQIRAQLAAVGCPVCGDKKYGGNQPYDQPGIALHHGRMEFVHPITRELLKITSS